VELPEVGADVGAVGVLRSLEADALGGVEKPVGRRSTLTIAPTDASTRHVYVCG